jgi:hypothetical protein
VLTACTKEQKTRHYAGSSSTRSTFECPYGLFSWVSVTLVPNGFSFLSSFVNR